MFFRAFEHIFEAIDASENMKYLVHASYLEIYNEDLFDLLGKLTHKLHDFPNFDRFVVAPRLNLLDFFWIIVLVSPLLLPLRRLLPSKGPF